LFVGLMATRYAPELDFRGTVALAPPVHMPLLIGSVTADGSRPISILTPYLLAGLPVSHPGFDPRGLLTEEGGQLVELAADAPLMDVLRASRGMTNDHVGTTELDDRAGVAELLDTCRVPVVRLDRPVLMTAGTADEVVPFQIVERFADDLRAAGSEVEFLRHEGANHATVLTSGLDAIMSWTADVLAAPGRASKPAADGGRDARFSLIDATGDGYVTRDDYEAFALRLVQAFGEPPGSPAALAVREGYRRLWQAVAGRAEADRDGRITEEEFLAWIDGAGGDDSFDDEIAPLAAAVIALADTDGDGVLTEQELARLLAGCGVTESQARHVFDELDRDDTGGVDTGELVSAIRAFWLSPSADQPGSWLFGTV
jgi:Ca2+-binding EF-hand superfamily protein